MTDRLRLKPLTLKAANEYITQTHRHHPPTRGHKFSVGVVDEAGELRGVGVAGRPVSRVLDGQGYLEVVRVATDGTKNACSMLYGALRRAGIALGYPPERIITYTLASEPGSSLRASGWIDDGPAGGGSWSRIGRERTDNHPIEEKRRWRAG